MRKAILTLVLIFICAASLSGYRSPKYGHFEISTKRRGTTIDFIAEGVPPGRHTVIIIFQNLHNSTSGNYVQSVLYGNGTFFAMRPINSDYGAPTYNSYSYHFCPGIVNPKIDTNFVYRLPYKEGIEGTAWVYKKEPKNPNIKNISYSFTFDKCDTVYSMRKGLVTEITALGEKDSDGHVSNDNKITVEHDEGTFIEYYSLTHDFLVKEGDMVYPGTPIGIAKKHYDEYVMGAYLYYKVCYDNLNTGDVSLLNRIIHVNTAEMVVSTLSGNVKPENKTKYSALVTDDLITKEMTRKERKDYSKAKK